MQCIIINLLLSYVSLYSYNSYILILFRPSKLEYLDRYQYPEDDGKTFVRPPFAVKFKIIESGRYLHFKVLALASL